MTPGTYTYDESQIKIRMQKERSNTHIQYNTAVHAHHAASSIQPRALIQPACTLQPITEESSEESIYPASQPAAHTPATSL